MIYYDVIFMLTHSSRNVNLRRSRKKVDAMRAAFATFATFANFILRILFSILYLSFLKKRISYLILQVVTINVTSRHKNVDTINTPSRHKSMYQVDTINTPSRRTSPTRGSSSRASGRRETRPSDAPSWSAPRDD